MNRSLSRVVSVKVLLPTRRRIQAARNRPPASAAAANKPTARALSRVVVLPVLVEQAASPGGGRGGFGGGRFGGGAPRAGRFNGGFGNRRRPSGIRGALSYTVNNSAVNAKPFSITGQDIPEPSYAQNRFSVLLGGPLIVPKLVKDPSTFFFLSYFGTRARNPYSAVTTVPSLLERNGNFSQSIQSNGAVEIFDPSTRQPFAGNAIPAAQISPIALKLLPYIPLPNQPGFVNNYQFQTAIPQNTDNSGVRLQRNITKKDRLAYTLNFQHRDGATAQPFQFIDRTNGFGLTTALTWTRNIGPNLVSNARVTFNRNSNHVLPFFAFGPDVASALGIAGTSSSPINFGPPNLSFTNFGALSDPHLCSPVTKASLSARDLSRITVVIQSVLVRSTGATTSLRKPIRTPAAPSALPVLKPALSTTAFPFRAPASTLPISCWAFPSRLPSAMEIPALLRSECLSAYAQDEYRLHPRLTLNLGLRYEYFSPFAEKNGRMANLDIAPGYTGVAVVTPGNLGPYTGAFPSALINPDRNNVSPRLGLAWKGRGIKRSTIIARDTASTTTARPIISSPCDWHSSRRLQFQATSLPASTTCSLSARALPGDSGQDVLNTYAVDRFYRTPYAQSWSVSVQHELAAGMFASRVFRHERHSP